MDEFVADATTGPTATENGLVAIEALLAHFAMARFDREQQWLPRPAGFSDTHSEGEYSEARRDGASVAGQVRRAGGSPHHVLWHMPAGLFDSLIPICYAPPLLNSGSRRAPFSHP